MADTELSSSLEPRHLAMISIGGIIGAGLFVGSSASIAAAGPAIVVSYLITGTLVLLVMRMLGEMAMSLPTVRSFTEFARAGLGPWAGFVAGGSTGISALPMGELRRHRGNGCRPHRQAFTPSLEGDLHVSLIALAVAVLAFWRFAPADRGRARVLPRVDPTQRAEIRSGLAAPR